MQQTCRKKGWPLDKSTLFTHVTKFKSKDEVEEKLESGTYVAGLYLEGASWDDDDDAQAAGAKDSFRRS